MNSRVAIVEIGGSHDECILSQLIGLKEAGAWIALCATRNLYERNPKFATLVDEFHEVVFPKTAIGDFQVMRKLNKWFAQEKISRVVCNTAQGGHIRNLTLTAAKNVRFFGLIHTIKMLDGRFTQRLISGKIKDYFILNQTLVDYADKPTGIRLHVFYPLSYPSFNLTIEKDQNECWISVIGGIENRRKDLDGLVQMLRLMPLNVKLILLGKSDEQSEDFKNFFAQLKANNLENRVAYFNHFLEQEMFDAYLKNTDAIFPLVHPGTPSADEYFTRQISGAINVAFSYKIPMMIHADYSDWQDFQTGVVFYEFENFQKQFEVFVNNLADLKISMFNNPTFDARAQNQNFAEIVLS